MKSAVITMTLMLSACASSPPVPPPPPPAKVPTTSLTSWTDNFGSVRNASIPQDVREFIIERQGCDHFRGEVGYNKERAAFLNEKIDELCTGSDKKLYDLRVKYVDDAITIKALGEFDDCIEYSNECITKLE